MKLKSYLLACGIALISSQAVAWTDDQGCERPGILGAVPSEKVGTDNGLSVALVWTDVTDSQSYLVYRNGDLRGEQAGQVYYDYEADLEKSYEYTVIATTPEGRSCPSSITYDPVRAGILTDAKTNKS